MALFNQYDDEYCSKSTSVATSIQKISALSGGTIGGLQDLTLYKSFVPDGSAYSNSRHCAEPESSLHCAMQSRGRRRSKRQKQISRKLIAS